MSETLNSENSANNGVVSRKNPVFKIRIDAAIQSTGLSRQNFYRTIGISRQQWYYFSWDIIPFPTWLKIKLCDTFGKPFRDLFLQENEEVIHTQQSEEKKQNESKSN